ncbi:hypothetical protein [Solihabitans fulvus]|uniref:hypothetical protein n=1 Tax=Solihabitans fulvus TaxID=1892852 RepID=UPI001661DDB1|nr:hypothetical protein [Solihabitans fulvus]
MARRGGGEMRGKWRLRLAVAGALAIAVFGAVSPVSADWSCVGCAITALVSGFPVG